MDWAETSMMEADFEEKEYNNLRDIVSRLALTDVKAFGITWEDFENFLSRLGYRIDLRVTEIQAVLMNTS